MLCVNCGREFEGKFCPCCGQPVPVPVVCKGCGTRFEGNFCTNCGTPHAAGENSSADKLIDKFGNELDVHYIATLYETEKKIKRFLMLATKYSPSEIEKRARYIHESVDEYDYGEMKCFSERGKLNETYSGKNQSLAKLFASVAIGLSVFAALLYVLNGLFGLLYTEEPPYTYVQSYTGGTVSDATTYQSVLDDYTEKLKEATPVLIDEYNTEASANTEGLNGLAKISNAKIYELAEISTDGIEEMAKIYLNTGAGKSGEYEEWAGKLQEVYTDEAGKIAQAYMDSAT